MADIAKCAGRGCHRKDECYRYTVPDTHPQSYALFYAALTARGCAYFMPNVETDNGRKE